MEAVGPHMTPQDRLNDIAKQLREKNEVQPITVRELLGWYGAERRGSWIVWQMQQQLKEAGLDADPDFQAAYIDSQIKFVLAKRIGHVEIGQKVPSSMIEPSLET